MCGNSIEARIREKGGWSSLPAIHRRGRPIGSDWESSSACIAALQARGGFGGIISGNTAPLVAEEGGQQSSEEFERTKQE